MLKLYKEEVQLNEPVAVSYRKIHSKRVSRPRYLNTLGKQGWELIFLDRLSGTRSGIQMKWLAVFKKQLVEKEK